ncbi:MAG: aminotransferase class III-fold pyridoxal phosphate-dependent enzyme [Tannerellaceae bacterium]|jgi:acetylornithine aminotransferase|nr:aminotransferase class III-fold pyridoxal phosphate-dependent enzyme [Tannerellaceae bacterium]
MNLFDVYPLFDINIVKGQGRRITDDAGNQYLDLYGGHAVISIGHSHPLYIQAITEQLSRIGFYSNYVVNPLQQQLAEQLGAASGYDDYSLFLINSGAEANENALKLASFHNGKRRAIAFKRSFHGRTSVAVRVTDNPAIQAPINEGMPVTFLPFGEPSFVEEEFRRGDVSSLIIEGLQGVSGIYDPGDDFLRALRSLCTQYGVCMILDEIQSGYGRTGRFFAHQQSNIRPDIITVAKGMANGFPIGATLISPIFKPVHGMLGTTFGGNHLACAAAIAVLNVIEKEKLIDNAARVGKFLADELSSLPSLRELRGRGLMLGLEFDRPIHDLRRRLLFNQKIFTGAAGSHTLRLLPPLSLSHEEAAEAIDKIKKAVADSM